MKGHVLSALAGGALLALAGTGAQAFPAAPPSDAPGLVHQVAEGCGPGFFRGRRGFCRPMRGPGFYGPPRGPRFYGPPPGRRFYGPPPGRGYYGPRY